MSYLLFRCMECWGIVGSPFVTPGCLLGTSRQHARIDMPLRFTRYAMTIVIFFTIAVNTSAISLVTPPSAYTISSSPGWRRPLAIAACRLPDAAYRLASLYATVRRHEFGGLAEGGAVQAWHNETQRRKPKRSPAPKPQAAKVFNQTQVVFQVAVVGAVGMRCWKVREVLGG